ncbi:MAG: hypothetical protein Q7S04_03785 [Candidatus Moranbacteria bacterium]|nr:hypothetical protein [Candidatus Moranbacteria bacterium]
MRPLIDTFVFFLATGILFYLPGWTLLRVFFKKQSLFSPLERLILSFGISLGLIDFLMIIIGKLGIAINIFSLFVGMIATLALLVNATFITKRLKKNETRTEEIPEQTFSFSRRQGTLFIILIALTLFIKVIYLTHAILPTATDLGHHMYWSKLIVTTGTLPSYAKQEIITGTDGIYRLTEPEPIPDFIIGEHLPFAALSLFTGLDFLSAFPVVFLLLINVLSLLTLSILALRFASGMQSPLLPKNALTPQNIALATLFFFGPLFTLASPQAKFVSGGVVGNVIGNFFIPLILLVLYRAFREKRPGFLALGFFLTFVLAYTHHLSTLILLFVLVASMLLYLITHYDTLETLLSSWWKLVSSPGPLLVACLSIVFFFGVAMPTYIETNAVVTAIGTPTKTTRTGLSFFQLASSGGEARIALGLVGLAILAGLRRQRRYAGAFLIGWCAILLIMTLRPQWLFIDIPSNRIVTYFSFPIGLLSAFATITFFATLRNAQSKLRVPGMVILIMSLTLFVFSLGNGSLDNNQTLLPKSKALSLLQTFSASRYLAEHSEGKNILKDHNYIAADSWIKLFFLRDYAYPLSRGFFKRYEDNPNREQCTLLMISIPNTARGEKCYADLDVNFVIINPHFDTTQFEKSEQFSRIYASDDIHIYQRKK